MLSADRWNGTALRLRILKVLYECWERAPGTNQLIDVESVYQTLKLTPTDRLHLTEPQRILLDGAWQGLEQQGLIARQTFPPEADGGPVLLAARITTEGLEYLHKAKTDKQTRLLAYTGALTGALGLVVSVIKVILDMLPSPHK